jgi:alpha-amylase
LRNAIYRHLIAADEALDEAEGLSGPRASLSVGDWNLDARQEVRLENDRLIAFIRPALGGHLYELDVRHARTNLLNTLNRRPESYHGTIARAARGLSTDEHRPGVSDEVILKQEGLDERLIYDPHARKALVDHFLPMDVTLDDLARCREVERGDFADGTYLAKTRQDEDAVSLDMERPGIADGHPIKVRKVVTLKADDPALEVRYTLEDLPEGVPLRFSVECNLASMAGHAEDRYFISPQGEKLGMLDSRHDLSELGGIALVDEWLDLKVGLSWSRPAGIWTFPVETVSQSEGGFEGVYQSSAVYAHWIVTADESRRWEVRMRLAAEPVRIEAGDEARSAEQVSVNS